MADEAPGRLPVVVVADPAKITAAVAAALGVGARTGCRPRRRPCRRRRDLGHRARGRVPPAVPSSAPAAHDVPGVRRSRLRSRAARGVGRDPGTDGAAPAWTAARPAGSSSPCTSRGRSAPAAVATSSRSSAGCRRAKSTRGSAPDRCTSVPRPTRCPRSRHLFRSTARSATFRRRLPQSPTSRHSARVSARSSTRLPTSPTGIRPTRDRRPAALRDVARRPVPGADPGHAVAVVAQPRPPPPDHRRARRTRHPREPRAADGRGVAAGGRCRACQRGVASRPTRSERQRRGVATKRQRARDRHVVRADGAGAGPCAAGNRRRPRSPPRCAPPVYPTPPSNRRSGGSPAPVWCLGRRVGLTAAPQVLTRLDQGVIAAAGPPPERPSGMQDADDVPGSGGGGGAV